MFDNEKTMPEPVKVRNKDILILARVRTAMRDVTNIEEMREWIQDRMYNITQHLSGMPGGSSMPRGLDDTYARLSELDDEHKEKCRNFMEELTAAEEILNRIQDEDMKTFVVMKYVMDIPGVEIMRQLNMSEWKYKQARRCIEQATGMTSAPWKPSYMLDEGKIF